MTATRTWIPALALTAGLAFAPTPAQAQPNGNAWGWQRQHQPSLQAAWSNGYRAGYDQGRADVRSRRYDYRRHEVYRDGTRGYDRRDLARDDYRRAFQEGFSAGYVDGFYGRSERGPVVYPAYSGRPGAFSRYADSVGLDRGYREGLDKGRGDREHRRAYDPRGEKWYRQGDRGYQRGYGSKEVYKDAYRDGFLRGYDEGYRRW